MKTIKLAVVASVIASAAVTSAYAASGDTTFKARLGYLAISDKFKGETSTTKHAMKDGYIGEVAAGYFLTDNIALEGAVGYGRSDLKRTATSNNKKSAVSIIPVTGTLQYHFVPSAKVSPYVGVGYSYQFASGGPTGSKIDNGSGVVGQIGADIPMNKTFGLNVDVKYTHKAKHDVTFAGTKYKNKASTIATMVGVTFPF